MVVAHDTRGPGHRFGGYRLGPGSVIDDNVPYLLERDLLVQDLPG